MATYEAWNKAVAVYFTSGAARESPIFLSLDLEAIEEIAFRFLDEPVQGDPLVDFVEAVRHCCIGSSQKSVNIEGLKTNVGDIPAGVGFLGLLVYAAYQMQEQEGIDETNYFLRLREVLKLQQDKGRPEGMRAGAEEPLWKAWNKYLTNAGFQETAERGKGPQTYLRYVLSQSILRESDKQYLRQRFYDTHLSSQLDCDQLGFWLSRQHDINRRHLSEGLHHHDPKRIWEFYSAAYRVYEAGDWFSGAAHPVRADGARIRNIECGLYRTEDLPGEPQYWLFPKQPARMQSLQLAVSAVQGAKEHTLRLHRSGFFAPLWLQAPFVNAALEFSVVGDPAVKNLLFPKRDFWILMRDPENQWGVWATWQPYQELGEQLIVLCRKGLFDDEMARFKAAKLLQWNDRVECEEWIEYHGCMVLSYDWGGFIITPECRALADALAPRAIARVFLSGGLRDPNQNAWLEGFPPTMKVYGFESHFELVVTSAQELEVYGEEVTCQQEVALPWNLDPGTYEIEVKWSGKRITGRVFRIVSWDSVQEHPDPEEITNFSQASTAGLSLRGALIVQDAGDSNGVAHA